jgi:hypothetical protein
MKTCHVCGVTKANSQLFRLGETDLPICKSCKSMEQPEAEFEAMRVASIALENLSPTARQRAMAYLNMRYRLSAD